MRGRLNANTDGVFRCTSDGLFFEITPTLPGQPPVRTHVFAAEIGSPVNATITELIEFMPDDGEDVRARARASAHDRARERESERERERARARARE
jgi:hypothetical protein